MNTAFARIQGSLRDNAVFLVIVAIALVVALAGDPLETALRYDRDAILHGQVWRLLTGNFVHLGWSHLWLNLAGLVLIWLLFKQHISTLMWIIATVLSALAVGMGLLWLNPELTWYVGLSGVLHGLFAMGALLCVRLGYRFELLLVALLTAKLVWEQFYGALPGSERYAGGAVIVDAHLYGAVMGVLLMFSPGRWALRPVRSPS